MSKLGRQLIRSLKDASNTVYRQKTGKRDWLYELEELKYAAMDTLFYSWWTPIVVFWESCEQVVKWFPMIWKGRDWDSGWLLMMMSFKLKEMRKLHIKNQRHVGVEKTIRQLLICEQVLDRMSKDDYTDELMAEHRLKWFGDRNMWDILQERKHNPQETKEFRKIMDHGEYMYQQDVDMFCKLFKKYHRHWWD